MLFGDCRHQIEPKPAPLGRTTCFEPTEWFQHLRHLCGRNAGANVGHGENGMIALLPGIQRDPGADGGVPDGIVNEIDEELGDKPRILTPFSTSFVRLWP